MILPVREGHTLDPDTNTNRDLDPSNVRIPAVGGLESIQAVEVASSNRPRWVVALVVFLGALAVYLPTATYDDLQINDSQATAISAWSLGEHGTLVLPEIWLDVPWRSVTTAGDQVTNRFPGTIAWGAAFYALTPGSADPQRAHDVPFGPAGVAAALAAALVVSGMFLALDGVVTRPVAIGASLLLGFATGTWTVSADSLFTHGPAQLAFVLALLAFRYDRLWLAGLAMGGAITTRPTLAVAALLCGLWLGAVRRSLRPVVAIGLSSSLGLLSVSLYSWALFGRWLPRAGYRAGASGGELSILERVVGTDDSPALWENLWNTLLHPQRGILIYSSFLVVLVFGLRRGWRGSPDWGRASAIAGVAVLLAHLLVLPNSFHGGNDFFGYRVPLEMLTLATPLLAAAAERAMLTSRLARRALAITAVGSLAAFSLGATIADPRLHREAEYRQYIAELGPHGEGFDPDGVGYDAGNP